MAFDEGKYDVAAAIAGFFKDRKDARDTYLNQPLVQVWDSDTGSMVYKRRSEAVGMPSEKKVNYANKLTDAVEILDDTYASKVGDNYESIGDSEMFTNVITKKSGADMTQAEYQQALNYFEQYNKSTYGSLSDDGQGDIKAPGELSPVGQKVFQDVTRYEEALLNTKIDIVNVTKDYKQALIKAGIQMTQNGLVQLTEKATRGEVDDMVELYVVWGYAPNSDPKLNEESLKKAKQKRRDFKDDQAFVRKKKQEVVGYKKTIDLWSEDN